jgi:hypothetical protein
MDEGYLLYVCMCFMAQMKNVCTVSICTVQCACVVWIIYIWQGKKHTNKYQQAVGIAHTLYGQNRYQCVGLKCKINIHTYNYTLQDRLSPYGEKKEKGEKRKAALKECKRVESIGEKER